MTAHLLLFAKYPYAGTVKTRLHSALGEQGAQAFARTALVETLRLFAGDGRDAVRRVWCYAPSSAGEDVRGMLEREGVSGQWTAWPQADDAVDLGARLAAAVQHHQSIADRPAVLIGSDCFFLTPQHVTEAIDHAHLQNTAVIVPATDGGYVMLVVPPNCPSSAFEATSPPIRWSSPHTCDDQVRAIEAHNIHVRILTPALQDVDEPADLQTLLHTAATDSTITRNYAGSLAIIRQYMPS